MRVVSPLIVWLPLRGRVKVKVVPLSEDVNEISPPEALMIILTRYRPRPVPSISWETTLEAR